MLSALFPFNVAVLLLYDKYCERKHKKNEGEFARQKDTRWDNFDLCLPIQEFRNRHAPSVLSGAESTSQDYLVTPDNILRNNTITTADVDSYTLPLVINSCTTNPHLSQSQQTYNTTNLSFASQLWSLSKLHAFIKVISQIQPDNLRGTIK